MRLWWLWHQQSVKHDPAYWVEKDPFRSKFPPAQKMAWRKRESNLILARVLFRINPRAGVVPNSVPCQIMHPLVLVGLGVGVGEGLGLGVGLGLGNQVAISTRGCIIRQGCRFRHNTGQRCRITSAGRRALSCCETFLLRHKPTGF